MRIAHWFWVLWGALSVWGFQTVSLAEPSVDWQKLFDGEVLIKTVQHAEGIPGILAKFVVAAPPERIWATLLDYENFPKIFKGVEKIRVLEQSPSGAQVECWVSTVFKNIHYVLARRYDHPGRRLSWSQLRGDLKRMEGHWEIRDTALPGSQLVVYESYIELDGGPPAALVRWVALEKTRQMSERLRNWIEGRPLDD